MEEELQESFKMALKNRCIASSTQFASFRQYLEDQTRVTREATALYVSSFFSFSLCVWELLAPNKGWGKIGDLA